MRAPPPARRAHAHGMRAQLAAALAAASARVHLGFCGSSSAVPPAASIFCLALSLNAAALITSFLLSSPVPST